MEDYQVLDFETAAAMYGHDKTHGLLKFQRQLDKNYEKYLLNLSLKRKEADKKILSAKKGDLEAILWLQEHFSLKIYTSQEIQIIRPTLIPPKPTPKPFILNFRGQHE